MEIVGDYGVLYHFSRSVFYFLLENEIAFKKYLYDLYEKLFCINFPQTLQIYLELKWWLIF